jgi:hypothetical protein
VIDSRRGSLDSQDSVRTRHEQSSALTMKTLFPLLRVYLCGLSLACASKVSLSVSDAVYQAERATENAPANPDEDRILAEHLAELLIALPYVDSVSEREKEMFEYRFSTIARQHDPSVNLNLRGCVSAAGRAAFSADRARSRQCGLHHDRRCRCRRENSPRRSASSSPPTSWSSLLRPG